MAGSTVWMFVRFGAGAGAVLLLSTLVSTGCGNPAAPTVPASAPDAISTSATTAPPDLTTLLLPPFATLGSTNTTEAQKDKPHYAAIAVATVSPSDLFPGFQSGTNLQGVWNQAVTLCDDMNRGRLCGLAAWCGPPQLNRQHPYVAFYRSTVGRKSPLERGVSGFACGYKTATAARDGAIAQCRWAGCDVGPHSVIPVKF